MLSIPNRMHLADARRIRSRNDEHTRRDEERREANFSAFRARVAANRRAARCTVHAQVSACGRSRIYQLRRSGFFGTGKIAKRHSRTEVEYVHALTDPNDAAKMARIIFMDNNQAAARMMHQKESSMHLPSAHLLLLHHTTPPRSCRLS